MKTSLEGLGDTIALVQEKVLRQSGDNSVPGLTRSQFTYGIYMPRSPTV